MAKKSLGQNFLVDQNIINKIINIGNIKKDSKILEIGPGYGSLTKKILEKKPKKVFVVEKDKELISALRNKFGKYKCLRIIHGDILNIKKLENEDKNIIVFGNLPYNISTQILASLILNSKTKPWFKLLILMFQKEVADRILAKPNSKNFGRLAVLSKWKLDIKKHFDISGNCFSPKPKIDSTVLSFSPKIKNEFDLKDPKILEKITRILFSNRRKMINKSFSKLFENYKDVAKSLNLELNKRPGELSIEMFYRIAIRYEKSIC
jgi:16S rRNA (adenine1518-N6/adenine1519-N6)-dimethyltransferase